MEDLLRRGTLAFIDEKVDDVIEIYQEIIRIDPQVNEAWETLGAVWEMKGDMDRALQARIVAAHMVPTTSQRWSVLGGESYREGLLRQAEHCFSQAVKADRNDDTASFNRAHVLFQLQEYPKAAKAWRMHLQLRPFDPEAVNAYIDVLIGLNDIYTAIELLEKLKQWNMRTFPNPQDDRTFGNTPPNYPSRHTMDATLACRLADLYLSVGYSAKAIDTIRQVIRWLQTRHRETFWDTVQDDDREYDMQVGSPSTSHRKGGYPRNITAATPHGIPAVARLRLCRARLQLGHIDEAMVRSSIILF